MGRWQLFSDNDTAIKRDDALSVAIFVRPGPREHNVLEMHIDIV
jgi:hypothetical protein